MGRGAVGMAATGKARYRLLLWKMETCREAYWTAGLPWAQWWSHSADLLRRQAAEGKDCVERQGMYYQLWDTREGKQLDLATGD